MSRQVTWSAGKPGVEDILLFLEGNTAAYDGELTKARGLYDRATASAKAADEKEVAAGYEAIAGLREALFGNSVQSKQQAEVALQLSKGQVPEYASALALALSGNIRSAEPFADDLNKRFPEDTLVQFNYLPALRAAIALGRGSSASAIHTLEPAVPYDLASFFTLPLYPAYFRGMAYLGERRGGEAAAEFQKVLDHRGLVSNDPIGALAHFQIGRAYVIVGDTARAKAAYNDFLTLWKDADPDIPILKQAKAEYSKLQ